MHVCDDDDDKNNNNDDMDNNNSVDDVDEGGGFKVNQLQMGPPHPKNYPPLPPTPCPSLGENTKFNKFLSTGALGRRPFSTFWKEGHILAHWVDDSQ